MTQGLTEFSRALVTSGDLDPIYTMLRAAELPRETLHRWCVAYWLFYHAGVASQLADLPDRVFWTGVALAASPETKTPRGTERRHFRGENARLAINTLATQYLTPSHMVSQLRLSSLSRAPLPLPDVMATVMEWPQFGPWIAFKVADMADAVLDIPVEFAPYVDRLFAAPLLGAYLHVVGGSVEEFLAEPFQNRVLCAKEAMGELERELWDLRCPHAPERRLRTQEFETMLCKWKSHLNGHYTVGKDTHEIRTHLTGRGPLAQRLLEYLPHG